MIDRWAIPSFLDEAPVGSEAIFPGKPGNDHDVAVLVSDIVKAAVHLSASGWEKDGSQDYANGSWRKGRENIILSDSYAFFQAFKVASELCRHLAEAPHGTELLSDRDVRVFVHKTIRSLAMDIEKKAVAE